MLNILRAVKSGVEKPTRIMYAANLAYNPSQKFIKSLVEQGLLNERIYTTGSKSKKRYELTEKGNNTLSYFDGISDLIDVDRIYSAQ
jgi:predicted transcriptional regulator